MPPFGHVFWNGFSKLRVFSHRQGSFIPIQLGIQHPELPQDRKEG